MIFDAQLALQYWRLHGSLFPQNFKNDISPLKNEANNLQEYLSGLISEYEKSGNAGELITLPDLNKLEDLFDKEGFIMGFSHSFHAGVKLIGKEILDYEKSKKMIKNLGIV